MVSRIDLDAPPVDYIGSSWGIIDAITEGDETIEHLCKTWGISQGAFYRTVQKHPDLKEAAAIARRIRAQRYADQALELAKPATNEDGSPADWQLDNFGRYSANSGLIQRDSLRIKTLLHLAAKLDPEQFGDRIIQDTRDGGKAMLVIGDTAKAAALIAEARKARLATPVVTEDSSEPSKQLKSEADSNEQRAK